MKLALCDVTIQGFYAHTNLPPLLSFANLQRVEFTDVHIRNNGVGALELFDTVAVFRGNNTFKNNSGYDGGAIALYANSYITVQANSTLEITNNTAANFGGGIYIAGDQLMTIDGVSFCFILLQDESAKIILNRNQAKITGAELYGGDISTCATNDGQNMTNLTTALGLITNTSDCGQTNVSSDVKRLTFCEDHCIDIHKTETSISLYPGTQLNVPIAATGQLEGLTEASIILTYSEIFDHNEQI